MENFFLEARQIISQIYNKNDKNYNYLLFSCFALLSNYSNYREIIEYIFLNTLILIENKSLIDIVRNHKELGLMITDIDQNDYSLALSFNGISMTNNELNIEKAKIIISSFLDNSDVLNSLIHELCHLMKSFFNTYSYNNTGYIKIRNGLNFHESWADGINNNTNSILDEVINTLQTTKMAKNIKNLDTSIFSKEEKAFFEQLDFSYLGQIQSYENVTYLFEDLWKKEKFRNLFETDLITGNISNIENNFNTLFGDNMFNTLSFALDRYYYTEDKDALMLIENIIFLMELKMTNISKGALKKTKNIVK